jgi:hypothetical protein
LIGYGADKLVSEVPRLAGDASVCSVSFVPDCVATYALALQLVGLSKFQARHFQVLSGMIVESILLMFFRLLFYTKMYFGYLRIFLCYNSVLFSVYLRVCFIRIKN